MTDEFNPGVVTVEVAMTAIAEAAAHLQRLLDATAAMVHDLRPSTSAVEWDLATMDATDRLVVGASNVGHIAAIVNARLARVHCLAAEAAPPSLEFEPAPMSASADAREQEIR